MLVVDGHESQLTLNFRSYCKKNRTIVANLPSHSTHDLQPLNIGLFRSVAHPRSNELRDLYDRAPQQAVSLNVIFSTPSYRA